MPCPRGEAQGRRSGLGSREVRAIPRQLGMGPKPACVGNICAAVCSELPPKRLLSVSLCVCAHGFLFLSLWEVLPKEVDN